ncbi:hypothetical protein PHMEG_00029028 [Phytophthora megakarya]|uniref:Uncharacterized protein n=1 Tax=Phytophthora megakarya TaxID=4795 RepID=A0A225V3M4_9STRA|nr:hypothetical protein PHMEG_00029028 [Phytophthora megakarya]
MTNLDKTTDAATTETGAPTAFRAPSESTAASGSTTAEVIDVTADCRVAKRKDVSVDTEKMIKGKKKLVRDGGAPASQAEVPSVAEERDTSIQESTAATMMGQPVSVASTTPRRSTGFDLTEFMSSFNPGVSSEARSAPSLRGEPPVATPSPSAQDELRLLRQELEVLRGQVAGVRQSLGVRTEPSDQGEFPPGTVVELSCASFPEQSKKEKEEYIPPQAHVLPATRMFKGLSPSEGKSVSPMSFVFGLREAECVGFKTTPAVLMELLSGRLGSRGLAILHFREEDVQDALEAGSSNGN